MPFLLLLLSLAPCAPAAEPLDLFARAAKLTGAACPLRLPAKPPPRVVPEWEV